MERSKGNKIRFIFVGVVAIVLLGGRGAQGEIVMSEPINVGPAINDAQDMQECDFSHDGLELYLGSWDDFILRVCKRPSKDAPWGSPVKVGPPVGSLEDNLQAGSDDVFSSDISADGLSLYFASTRFGGYGGDDIWVTTRPTKEKPWTEPVNLGPNVNTGADNWSPTISSDGLTLIFNSPRLWASTRKSVEDSWGPAVNLGIYKQGNQGWQHGAALSPDGSCLYLEAYYSQWGGYGNGDFWQVDFIPIVNFNGDEIIDISDLDILIEHWGSEEPLYDIGPLPLGDGIVDIEDIEVLAEHLFEPVNDPTLVAHWPLDEAQGVIAYNNVAELDGTLIGDPVWQPDGGMVAGALQFDGIDDYVATDPIMNPADGRFTVIAWIKGGAPGQAISSQAGAISWLCTDSGEGNLMTELTNGGRSSAGPMLSQANITDGDWHRIGIVWDGSCRCLYVDGVEVAKDAAPLSDLESAEGDLYFGVGSDLAPDTFFSGLIDDIRIYNRAVSP